MQPIPQGIVPDDDKGTLDWWLERLRVHLDTAHAGNDPEHQCPAGPYAKLDTAKLRGEMGAIVDRALDRTDRLQEILDQADGEGVINYYTGMLGLNPAKQPNIHLLIRVGRKIGEVVVMRLKDYYKCPRPSRIHPLIVPAIDPPDTPSYPAGHSLQAHLISKLLTLALDTPRAAHLKDNTLQRALNQLAKRIADNRVVAGIHFEADNEAGKKAAQKCIGRITARVSGNPACPTIAALIVAARAEYR